MRVARLRSALLALAFSVAVPAAGQAPPATTAAPKPFEDVIRLHAAGLSEEFIVRKIARDGVVYGLSTDDIIACKKAGLPEPLIEAMLKTGPKTAGSPAPAPAPSRPDPVAAVAPAAPVGAAPASVAAAPAPVAAAPAPVAAPPAPLATAPPAPGPVAAPSETPAAAPSPSPPHSPTHGPAPALPAAEAVAAQAPAAVVTPAPAPAAPPAPAPVSFPERTFAGLVRRAPGVVLFKDPWEPGTLSFREGTLTWTDAGDLARPVVVAAAELTEHFLLCPKETDWEGACWEWGVKTATAEHRFRDATWETKPGPRPAEIHALVKAAMPGLRESRYRASKRK